jgi:hypothetical protein
MPNLIVKYTVQKIYIDGANPSFIKSLKMQWGERPDYKFITKEVDNQSKTVIAKPKPVSMKTNTWNVTIVMSTKTGFV